MTNDPTSYSYKDDTLKMYTSIEGLNSAIICTENESLIAWAQSHMARKLSNMCFEAEQMVLADKMDTIAFAKFTESESLRVRIARLRAEREMRIAEEKRTTTNNKETK